MLFCKNGKSNVVKIARALNSAAIAIALLTGAALAEEAEPAQPLAGYVFLDANGNKLRDAGEAGIAAVAVSDGLNVVQTDASGRYELPGAEKTRFVFISTPSGYRTSAEHYINVQGERPASIDFGLETYERSGGDTVRFVQVADTETHVDDGWIDNIRQFAANEQVDFIMHTGDICYANGMNFHAANFKSEQMGVPVYFAIGNHDLVRGKYGEELFEKLYGPPYYSFNAGNTHFVVTPMLGGDARPSYNQKDVARWMENDLRHVDPDMNLIVFNHFIPTKGDKFVYDTIDLHQHNLKAWIYGHYHSNYMRRHGAGGVLSFQSAPPQKGGINHSPGNFPVYDVSATGEIAAAPRYSYLDRHLVVAAPSGANAPVDGDGNLIISVNAYNSVAPIVGIEYAITGRTQWQSLERGSDWNWSARAAVKGLDRGGEYELKVKARLADGEEFASSQSFVYDGETDSRLKLDWVANAGANIFMTAPVYSDGAVYVSALEQFDIDNCHIQAYDAENGGLLWSAKVDTPILNTICVADGKVLGTDQEGTVYAFDARTGEPAWRVALGNSNVQNYVSGGVVRDGIYYTGYGNFLAALNVADGSLKWRNRGWNHGFGSTATHALVGDTLVVGANWGALYAHNIETGAVKWKSTAHNLRFRNSSVAGFDGTLYAPSTDSLVKLDPETGAVQSAHKVPYYLAVSGEPVVNDKAVILGTGNSGLLAFARESMEELWRIETGVALVFTRAYGGPPAQTVETTPRALGDAIVFGAGDGCLYIANPENGQVLEKLNLGAPVFAPVCIADDRMFAVDFGGNIYSYKVGE